MPESPAYPGTPRWVKVLGIVAIVAALTFVIVHLAGGGFRHHGPAKHDQSARMRDGR